MPCLNSTADNGNYSLVAETTNLLYSEARSPSIWSVFRRSLSSQSAIRLLSHVSSRVGFLKRQPAHLVMFMGQIKFLATYINSK